MEPQQLLTVQEVARRLRVKPPTVRAWIKSGQIPGYQFPEKTNDRQRQVYRVPQDTLNQILK